MKQLQVHLFIAYFILTQVTALPICRSLGLFTLPLHALSLFTELHQVSHIDWYMRPIFSLEKHLYTFPYSLSDILSLFQNFVPFSCKGFRNVQPRQQVLSHAFISWC